eukprot:scaffold4464_cov87-Skeletonema_marinoi.AAC.3
MTPSGRRLRFGSSVEAKHNMSSLGMGFCCYSPWLWGDNGRLFRSIGDCRIVDGRYGTSAGRFFWYDFIDGAKSGSVR